MTEAPRRLLHVAASPRGTRSRSAAVARRLIGGLGDARVETLDLFAADLPDFGGETIEGRYALIAGDALAPAVAAAWAEIRRIADHFLSFDGFVFSVPMWNFGIPYRLKHYIDLLTQPGTAFSVDQSGTVVGHAAGRVAILVLSGALDVRPGAPAAGLDHQMSYLKAWLGFIGVEDIRTIRLCPTYGAPEQVEMAMAAAYAEADALAADLSHAARTLPKPMW
jgi:FMN-dependent NADH-azoreductase